MNAPPAPSGDADARSAATIRDVLSTLAIPRRTGSAGWLQTTNWLQERLRALGYTVEIRSFTFSDWPARFGPPLIGVLVASGALLAWWLLRQDRPGMALSVLLSLQATAAAVLLSNERAQVRLPWGRGPGVNLYAGSDRPRYLVVAHRDSKSQPVPIGLRVVAAAIASLGWLVLTGGAVLQAAGLGLAPAAGAAAGAAFASGLILAGCTVGNGSPGALDNASGVAALIAIAERLHGRTDVAFLITDAEELGLAGANAAAGSFAFLSGVINLDGLDDRGPVHLLGPHGLRRRGGAPAVERVLCAAARSRDIEVRSRAVPRGLMLDHLAFTRAGVPAVSVLRGTLRSLTRVHRPADAADRLDGSGACLVAAIVCDALAALHGA